MSKLWQSYGVSMVKISQWPIICHVIIAGHVIDNNHMTACRAYDTSVGLGIGSPTLGAGWASSSWTSSHWKHRSMIEFEEYVQRAELSSKSKGLWVRLLERGKVKCGYYFSTYSFCLGQSVIENPEFHVFNLCPGPHVGAVGTRSETHLS